MSNDIISVEECWKKNSEREKGVVRDLCAFDKSIVGPQPFPWKSKELISLTLFEVVMYVAIFSDGFIVVKGKENILTPRTLPWQFPTFLLPFSSVFLVLSPPKWFSPSFWSSWTHSSLVYCYKAQASFPDWHHWRVSVFHTCQRPWALLFVSVWWEIFLWTALILFFPDLHVMTLTSTCVSTALAFSSVGSITSVSWKSKLQ